MITYGTIIQIIKNAKDKTWEEHTEVERNCVEVEAALQVIAKWNVEHNAPLDEAWRGQARAAIRYLQNVVNLGDDTNVVVPDSNRI